MLLTAAKSANIKKGKFFYVLYFYVSHYSGTLFVPTCISALSRHVKKVRSENGKAFDHYSLHFGMVLKETTRANI